MVGSLSFYRQPLDDLTLRYSAPAAGFLIHAFSTKRELGRMSDFRR